MKKTIILLGAVCGIQISQAAITVNFEAGASRDIFSNIVSPGSLWILVSSDDDTFAGGFGLDSSLGAVGSTNSDFFTGQTLSVGDSIGSVNDIVFAMGAFDTDGFAVPSLPLLEGNGVVAGQNFAFYFFADVIYTGPDNATSTTGEGTAVLGSQIGGFNSTTVESGFDNALVFDSDGTGGSYGGISQDEAGNVPNSAFTSVQLVPEPSSLLFSILGLSFALRRKR